MLSIAVSSASRVCVVQEEVFFAKAPLSTGDAKHSDPGQAVIREKVPSCSWRDRHLGRSVDAGGVIDRRGYGLIAGVIRVKPLVQSWALDPYE